MTLDLATQLNRLQTRLGLGVLAVVGAGLSVAARYPMSPELASLLWQTVDADTDARAGLAARLGVADARAKTLSGDDVGRLMFVEPDTATLAVVNTADGSVADVRRRPLSQDDESAAELVEMVKGGEEMEAHPEGVFVVGSGVDIALIKPALEAATSLPVSAPEEPEMALARGAALASASAPIFASSTAAVA